LPKSIGGDSKKGGKEKKDSERATFKKSNKESSRDPKK
jgi:hypothetical protein